MSVLIMQRNLKHKDIELNIFRNGGISMQVIIERIYDDGDVYQIIQDTRYPGVIELVINGKSTDMTLQNVFRLCGVKKS